MARTTESEKKECRERLVSLLKDCGPDGSSTLLISEDWKGSGAPHVDVQILKASDENGGRPTLGSWLAFNVAKAFGYRFSRKTDCLVMGGHGYSRSTEVVSGLSALCGHPLFVQTTGATFGPNGWFPRAPK